MAADREWEIGESATDQSRSVDSGDRILDAGERGGSAPETPDGVQATGDETQAATPGGSDEETPSAFDPVGTLEPAQEARAPEGGEKDAEHLQKRIKRAKRKELLELIHKKNAMLMELDKELRIAKQDLVNKEDRILRMAAEFENYKKRTRREWELLQKQANADLIREIIWGIDNFDRAFASLGGEEDHIQEGIRLIHSGLMDILQKAGLTEIEAQEQKFNPQLHEAVGEIESDIAEGHVAQVIQKGYMLHDQILRPARVLVSKKRG